MIHRLRLRSLSYDERLARDLVPRPHYGYCIHAMAQQAKRMGYPAMSVMEFGVAGGRGLLAAEQHILQIESLTGLEIHLFGFDTSAGMPKPTDPRDVPYLWFQGDFIMDLEALENRLTKAQLVLGDVAETCRGFFDRQDAPPLGCALFDVDYYSSTVGALGIFNTSPTNYLPRVACYFDNVIGRLEFPMNKFIGELAAIEEFNRRNEHRKIGQVNALHWKRAKPAKWNEQVYVFQDFKHPKYAEPIRNPNPSKGAL